MKGYAIEIELFKWQQEPGEHATFEKLQSRYVGAFSEEFAQQIYKDLNSILDREIAQKRAERNLEKEAGDL